MLAARLALGLCLILAGTVIALHASALPYALWQGDEYDYFYNQSHTGSSFFWHRLLFWSPRPLSEAIIALYGLCVAQLHAPLIGPMLSTIWVLCAALAFLPTILCRALPQNTRLFLIALSSIIVFLGHPIADLMFWPMATAAHLPVLAAAFCLTLSTLTHTERPWLTALCLSVAAISSEAGFFFSGAYLSLTAFLTLVKPAQPRQPLKMLWVPAALCLFVLWRLLAGRIGLPHPHNTPTQGAILQSLRSSLLPFVHNLAMLQPMDISAGGREGGTTLHGLLLKTLIAFSSFTALRAANIRPSLRSLMVLSVSFLACNALIIASAYYEFGFLCCQRHETLRLDVSLLLAMLAGGYAARTLPHIRITQPKLQLIACACLIMFTLDTARWRYADMALFLRSRPLEAQARIATWQSGISPGPMMTMSQGTNSALFYYWPWEPGHYMSGGTGWDVQSMMKFFNKTHLTVLPPHPVSIPTRTH
ncbi:hypothetical protein [Neokomagataea thailandica]|uniref:Glycosyltransferase RgtA/B/C/D-like domain-containing protein n=1 Tax=Neokomagataea tanensis NBRC 106556 TaxID=1223519 RepID=A0ABQ0QFW1_9PROT|nr:MULTISPECIES: hypothetical protein [Neokomagataea]GBR43377.1 hypothetical protein AA106556_0069 [Neokomagataea tanensis NBRC 106556]